VEPSLLAAISAQYPWVEWGVLCREDKAGLPRYASSAWLERLGEVNAKRTMRLAAHLCSCHVDELLRGEKGFVARLHDEVGFRRVQINATAANGCDVSLFETDALADACVTKLRSVCEALPHIEFIVQRNKETRPLWERLLCEPPANMSMLFDDSMGLGVSTTSWPAPPPSGSALRFGYAGGLSPTNLAAQLELIEARAPGRSLWVDMESSLRTLLKDDSDIFDANKVPPRVHSHSLTPPTHARTHARRHAHGVGVVGGGVVDVGVGVGFCSRVSRPHADLRRASPLVTGGSSLRLSAAPPLLRRRWRASVA
jgi:hypothetical protein